MSPPGGLRHFLAVCASRNLTAAAASLGVSQPALTQAIAKLEKELDVPLLDRSTRPLGITPYGQALMEYAQRVEREAADIRSRLEAMKTGSGGILRFGSGPDWIHEVLPAAVARLQARSPALRFQFTVALNDELRRRLDIGEIDFFFASISDVYFGSAYTTRILLRDRMLVIARRGHPIHRGGPKSLADVAAERWAMTGDETFGRQLVRRLFEQGRIEAPPPVVETNSVRAMINIVRRSDLLGFLSQTHCNAYPDIAPVAMSVDLPLREGGLVWRKDNPLLPAAIRLVEEAEGVIAGLVS